MHKTCHDVNTRGTLFMSRIVKRACFRKPCD